MPEHRITDYLGTNTPLQLESGEVLEEFVLAYETYGTLNRRKDNAVLICHALSGDQYVASENPATGRPGWWPTMVGPGKPIDTDRFFVICSNVLGGCMGSSGPAALNRSSGEVWAADFPIMTIADMVAAQERLISWLGITRLHAVVGGSMGGMQVLEWLRLYPDKLSRAVALATSYRQSVQGIAFHEVGRQAIINDPQWSAGAYLNTGTFPTSGLAIARMVAHITYLSETKMAKRFGRQLQSRNFKSYSLQANFQIESYLNHQGFSFAGRFDPNSYLYITRAIDFFNQAEGFGDCLDDVYVKALSHHKPPVLLISVSTDWSYPPSESALIEAALQEAGVSTRHLCIESDDGHDAFLLPHEEMEREVRTFLTAQNG